MSVSSFLNKQIALYRNIDGTEINWIGKESDGKEFPSLGKRFTAEIGFALNTVLGAIETVAYSILYVPSLILTPATPKPLNWSINRLKESAFATLWSISNLDNNLTRPNIFTDPTLAQQAIFNGGLSQNVINSFRPCRENEHIFVEGGDNCNESIQKLEKLAGIELSELEGRLQPGGYSHDGFIGENESLIKVLTNDNSTVHRYGLTHTKIAAELDEFLRQCPRSGGHVTFKGNSYYVKNNQSRGYQENPFGVGPKSSSDISISRLGLLNIPIVTVDYITEMLPDLIYRYGFYESKETPYRVAPESLIELFQLKS